MDEQSSAALSGAASGASMGAAAGPYGALIGGLAGGAIGYFGSSKTKRPTYEIPEEIKQNLSIAQMRLLQGLPEEQQQQFISNLQKSSQFALRQSNSRKSGIQGLAAINEVQNRGYLDLASANAQAKNQGYDQLVQANQVMADYKGQKFQTNELNKYYEDQAKAQAQQGALLQNLSTGMQMYGAYKNGNRNMNAPQDQPQQPGVTTPNPYQDQQTFTPNYKSSWY